MFSDAFGTAMKEFSSSEHAEVIAQALLLVKELHRDCPDIVEACDHWLQNKTVDRSIYDLDRVADMEKKSHEADMIYQKLEAEGKEEEGDRFFRQMCTFNGLARLYKMSEFNIQDVRAVLFELSSGDTDFQGFGRKLETNTILALRWKLPHLTYLLPVDENLDLDLAVLKNFYDCSAEDLAPPQRIKTSPGKRLVYRLQASDPEKDVFLSLGGQGLFIFTTGLLLCWFNLINLFFGCVFFIFGGGLMFLSVWALVSKFQGIKDYVESLETEKHPVRLNESTKIEIAFKKPVRLDRIVVTLDCHGYDASIAGEPGTEGDESLWFRQVVFSQESIEIPSNKRIENISICPTTLYSTDSPMKKVFWSIAVNYWIGKGKRRKTFFILVEK